MTAVQEVKRLFGDIDRLDDHILQDLAKVEYTSAIMVCKIHLPPGEVFRLPGEQFGIYIIMTDQAGNRVVKGIRTEPHEGGQGGIIALRAAKVAISAFTTEEPVVVWFNYHISSNW